MTEIRNSSPTIDQDRDLTREERTFIEHLLRSFGSPEAPAFVAQLDHARVIGKCSCGCPTIHLLVPNAFRVEGATRERILVDATGRCDEKLVGILVFQKEGLLDMLELYRLEGATEEPFALPPIDSLERIEWTELGSVQGQPVRQMKPRKLDSK